MKTIQLNIDNVLDVVNNESIHALDGVAAEAIDKVNNGTGAGNDFLGWVTLPSDLQSSLLDDIKATADDLRANCDVVVSIGIGGSYLLSLIHI